MFRHSVRSELGNSGRPLVGAADAEKGYPPPHQHQYPQQQHLTLRVAVLWLQAFAALAVIVLVAHELASPYLQEPSAAPASSDSGARSGSAVSFSPGAVEVAPGRGAGDHGEVRDEKEGERARHTAAESQSDTSAGSAAPGAGPGQQDTGGDKAHADAKQAPEVRGKDEKATTEAPPPQGPGSNIPEGKSRPLLDVLRHDVWQKPPPNTPVPAVEEFAVRPELVHFRAGSEKIIIATYANLGFKDLAFSFVHTLMQVGVKNLLVGTLDHKLLEELFYSGVPVATIGNTDVTENTLPWGSLEYKAMLQRRIHFVRLVLEANTEIFMCDVDVVFFRNPLPFLARYPKADVLCASDAQVRSRNDEGLEGRLNAPVEFNMGAVLYRPSDVTKRFVRNWTATQLADPSIMDQTLFNRIMRSNMNTTDMEKNDNMFKTFEGTLTFGVLPIHLMINSPGYFVMRYQLATRITPYLLHVDYACRVETKENRMREIHTVWDVPEWYNPSNGLLVFDNNVPRELLSTDNDTKITHAKLVEHQVEHLKKAFAVATLLNRTLVLPKMYAFVQDNLWRWRGVWSVDANVTGEPFVCCSDYIVAMWALKAMASPRADMSPPVEWREYTLLDNPRFPKQILESMITVKTCDGPDCREGNIQTVEGKKTIQIRRLPRSKQIVDMLAPLSEHKVMKFEDLQSAFGGWDDKELESKFNNRANMFVVHIGEC